MYKKVIIMNDTNANQPAFPVSNKEELSDNYVGKSLQPKIGIGLTKREYFAAMAMQGIMASWDKDNMPEAKGIELAAKTSISCADELLKQLSLP